MSGNTPNFVNISMDDETLEMLTSMSQNDGFEFSRSAFIRKLIREENARREKLIQVPAERHIQQTEAK